MLTKNRLNPPVNPTNPNKPKPPKPTPCLGGFGLSILNRGPGRIAVLGPIETQTDRLSTPTCPYKLNL
jgi:hypothetical protein